MGNVDVVLTIYDRVARGETVRELFHDDVEWSMPHPGGEARGLAEVGAFWRDYESTWTDRVLEVEEVRPLDDERVLVFFRETAVGAPAESRPPRARSPSGRCATARWRASRPGSTARTPCAPPGSRPERPTAARGEGRRRRVGAESAAVGRVCD